MKRFALIALLLALLQPLTIIPALSMPGAPSIECDNAGNCATSCAARCDFIWGSSADALPTFTVSLEQDGTVRLECTCVCDPFMLPPTVWDGVCRQSPPGECDVECPPPPCENHDPNKPGCGPLP
jgi:hypothetical protein